ncbi:MAG: type II secretion system secretin GspD, partial [Dokdonella sp.]
MSRLLSQLITLLVVSCLVLVAGCATDDPFHRRSNAPTTAGGPLTANNAALPTAPLPPPDDDAIRMNASGDDVAVEKPKPEIKTGTGKFINERAASAPRPGGGGSGDVSFNFENQPIQAVVKAILGEMLQENYIIAPNVGGNVTFSTSRPIRADQAMSVLETLLSWTGNTLVYENGRYTVLQLKDALPGKLTPRFGSGADGRGYEVRVFPLRYVSPTQMANLLKPYAKPEAVINADTSRSMIVLAGTPSELDNYRRTIETFDVDWLKGMSIGVFALQHQEVATLLPQLTELFGPEGESPLAGMFRFIPLEQGNSLIVITPNPDYLVQAEDWLNRLDTGATENSNQLYVYNVKNIKSPDLAGYLNEIFLGASPSSGSRSRTSGSVGPGQRAVTIGGLGGAGGALSGSRGAVSERNQPSSTPASPTAAAGANSGGAGESTIRISAIEENNQLMVMASPAEWNAIQSAIRKLDISPLQVQIEARILEVSLTGELRYGVQWWFQGLQGSGPGNYQNGAPYIRPYDRQQGLLGAAGPGTAGTIFSSYINSKFEVALSALETSGNAKALAAPSLVVANNQEAQINVGTQIPVVQTFNSGFPVINPGGGGGTGGGINSFGTSGSVQYLNTGVILSVTPRVNPGGLVYLDIQQEVSNPGTPAQGSQNPPINQRQLQTQIAVQSGETLLLGGLIQENNTYSDSSVPLLGKIPVLGKLFGATTKQTSRTELIILITPRVITNSEEAREMTEEYQRRFQS